MSTTYHLPYLNPPTDRPGQGRRVVVWHRRKGFVLGGAEYKDGRYGSCWTVWYRIGWFGVRIPIWNDENILGWWPEPVVEKKTGSSVRVRCAGCGTDAPLPMSTDHDGTTIIKSPPLGWSTRWSETAYRDEWCCGRCSKTSPSAPAA